MVFLEILSYNKESLKSALDTMGNLLIKKHQQNQIKKKTKNKSIRSKSMEFFNKMVKRKHDIKDNKSVLQNNVNPVLKNSEHQNIVDTKDFEYCDNHGYCYDSKGKLLGYYDENNKYYDFPNDDIKLCDNEVKNNINSKPLPPPMSSGNTTRIREYKFQKWFDMVSIKMGLNTNTKQKYLNKFINADANDINSITLFDNDILRDEVGISNKFHRTRILDECNHLKQKMNYVYKNWWIKIPKINADAKKQYYERFQNHGLITIEYIVSDIKNINILKNVMFGQKPIIKQHLDIIYNGILLENKNNNSNSSPEGCKSYNYHDTLRF